MSLIDVINKDEVFISDSSDILFWFNKKEILTVVFKDYILEYDLDNIKQTPRKKILKPYYIKIFKSHEYNVLIQYSDCVYVIFDGLEKKYRVSYSDLGELLYCDMDRNILIGTKQLLSKTMSVDISEKLLYCKDRYIYYESKVYYIDENIIITLFPEFKWDNVNKFEYMEFYNVCQVNNDYENKIFEVLIHKSLYKDNKFIKLSFDEPIIEIKRMYSKYHPHICILCSSYLTIFSLENISIKYDIKYNDIIFMGKFNIVVGNIRHEIDEDGELLRFSIFDYPTSFSENSDGELYVQYNNRLISFPKHYSYRTEISIYDKFDVDTFGKMISVVKRQNETDNDPFILSHKGIFGIIRDVCIAGKYFYGNYWTQINDIKNKPIYIFDYKNKSIVIIREIGKIGQSVEKKYFSDLSKIIVPNNNPIFINITETSTLEEDLNDFDSFDY